MSADGTLPAVQAPFPVTAPYRVVPAPRPLAAPPSVVLDDAWPAALARRLERLDTDPAGVLVPSTTTGSDRLHAAVRAAWDLLPLPRDGARVDIPLLGVRVDLADGWADRTGPTRTPAATERLLASNGLHLLVTGWLLACSDDLVVLRRDGAGVLAAELLAVCFPSGWPPRLRAGASLLELHAPVADGKRLQRAAPALSEALLSKGPLRQHIWGLDPDGRLDRDPSAPDAPTGPDPTDPAAWWLRVECQTSVPLPTLERALFTIRPYLVPLPSLPAAQCRVLADAVASMGVEARRYKGITAIADDVVRWLRLRVS